MDTWIRSLPYCFGLCCLLCLFACDGDSEAVVVDYSNCRYQQPEPIFYAELPQVSDYHFEYVGRGSEERFLLSDAVNVSIIQYGCDHRTQEFRFEFSGTSPCETPGECTLQVTDMLQSLSRLGPEYHVFRSWGRAIKEMAPQVEFGEQLPLTEGFWMKIDLHKSFGSTILLLTLSEKP